MASYPLNTIPPGKDIQIASVPGKLHKRMLSLGLPPGTHLTVLRNRNGAIVVGRHQERMAIGHNLAKQILVQVRQ